MATRLLHLLMATFALVSAGAFGYLALTPPATPADATPATFAVEPAVAELGQVRQNQTLTGSYAVVNRLPVAVDIAEVMKSCSCADAEVEPRHLEPGETATLRLAWKTGSKHGPSPTASPWWQKPPSRPRKPSSPNSA